MEIRTLLANVSEQRDRLRRRKWLRDLRALGMQIGENVNLPMTTWIDRSHCFLISIGDRCGFGNECAILAHDAMPNEFLDVARVGRVTIGESCHFGMRTVILPGVSVGPRCIVGAGSVVSKDIPEGSVAAGNPAQVRCTIDEYLAKQRKLLNERPVFPYGVYSWEFIDEEGKADMLAKLADSIGFMTGGYTFYNKGN